MIPRQILAAYSFLGKLSARSTRLVSEHSRMRLCPQGTTLIRKGDRVSGMYFVGTGRLRVFTLSPGGEEASLYSIDPGGGCLLAANAVFSDVLYPAWVEVASKEARLFSISAPAFRTLFNEEQVVRDFTLSVLSARVFDLMTSLEGASLHSLEDRLKSLLLRQANTHGEVELTHEKIALSLGTAREVVSRKLKQLSTQGLVSLQRGRIILLQKNRLA